MNRWFLGITITILAMAGLSFYFVWDLSVWFSSPDNFRILIENNFILNLKDPEVMPVFSGAGMMSFYILFAFDVVMIALSVYLIGYAIYLGFDGFGRISAFLWALIPGMLIFALAVTQLSFIANLFHQFSSASFEFKTWLDGDKEEWVMTGKFDDIFIFNGVFEEWVPNPTNSIIKILNTGTYVGYVTAACGVASPLLYVAIRR